MKGYIFLFLAALFYASMGALVKGLSISIGPYSQTFLRLIVSGILTFLLAYTTRKKLTLKSQKDYLIILFMGIVGYGLQIIFFTLALYHNTISNTSFIFSSYPIFSALFAVFILKEKLTSRIIFSLVLLLGGLFFIFDPQTLGTSLEGNIYALLGGITFALYIVGSRFLTKQGNGANAVTLWSVGLAVATSGIAAFGTEHVTLNLPFQAIIFLLAFGFLNFAAYNVMNKGFETVEASKGSIILMTEPIFGASIGFLLFSEIPTPRFLLGATLILIATFLDVFKTIKKVKKR